MPARTRRLRLGRRRPGPLRSGRRRRCRAPAARAALALFLLGSAAAAAQPSGTGVEITGGADQSGQNYRWTIRNRGSSPIVSVEFPHYHADTFIVPDGWDNSDCTNLARVGGGSGPGACRATPLAGEIGLRPNRTAEFGMRISRAGAIRRPGAVTVQFADGTRTVVDGVEVPSRATFGERYIMVIGMAVIIGGAILINLRRRRKQPAPTETDQTNQPTAPPAE